MKKITLIILCLIVAVSTVSAQDTTTRRRSDQTEFVTETHVRLTTQSLTIAEVKEATPPPTTKTTLIDYLSQSISAFLQSLRDIFNLN